MLNVRIFIVKFKFEFVCIYIDVVNFRDINFVAQGRKRFDIL